MYALSLAMTGLILSAANNPAGNTAAAAVHPARCSRLRRLSPKPPFACGTLLFRCCRILPSHFSSDFPQRSVPREPRPSKPRRHLTGLHLRPFGLLGAPCVLCALLG